jgi:hypothetical protein
MAQPESLGGIISGNFCWFMGVVEDITDPKKWDRVRVRIHGLHTDQTVVDPSSGKGIPPPDLPWSKVTGTCLGPRIHGFGTNHGLVEGTWVFGFSMDGESYNDLYIVGTIPGVPEDKNPNPTTPPAAFFGQDGKYPLEEYLKEPDVHRLARNILKYNKAPWKPIPLVKQAEAKKQIPTAAGDKWDEMDPAYAAEYPNNQVTEYPSTDTIGHTTEFDSTPGKERITLWHGPSHSYRDYHSDGSRMTKIVGKDYTIVLKDNNLFVGGNLNITAQGNVNILSVGNTHVKSDTSILVEASTTITAKAGAAITVEAGAAVTVQAAAECTVRAGAAVTIEALGDATLQAAGVVNVDAGGIVNVTAGLGISLIAPAFVNIDAALITLVGEVVMASV